MVGRFSVKSVVSLLIAVCILALFAGAVSAQPDIGVEEGVDTDMTSDSIRGSANIHIIGYGLLNDHSLLEELIPKHYGEEFGTDGRITVEGDKDEGVQITYAGWASDEPTHSNPAHFVQPESAIEVSQDGTLNIDFEALIIQESTYDEIQFVCEIDPDSPSPQEVCSDLP